MQSATLAPTLKAAPATTTKPRGLRCASGGNAHFERARLFSALPPRFALARERETREGCVFSHLGTGGGFFVCLFVYFVCFLEVFLCVVFLERGGCVVGVERLSLGDVVALCGGVDGMVRERVESCFGGVFECLKISFK